MTGGQIQVLNSWGDLESDSGRYRATDMPGAALAALRKLREASYRDGLGTWFSVKVTLTASGAMTAEYNYDEEPEWYAAPDPVAYLNDLEKFPRAAEHQPDWLKARIQEALRKKARL